MAAVKLVPASAPCDGGVVDIRLPKYGPKRTIPIPDRLAQMVVMHLNLPHRTAWLFAVRRSF